MRTPAHSPWLPRGLYLLAALLVLWPLVDLTANVWPIRIGDVQWRYGVGGLLASFLHTPMLGLALGSAVAWMLGHPRALRALAVAQVAFAGLLLGVMAIFALDALQVRATRPADMVQAVLAGAVLAEAKHFTAAVVLLILGVGCWATAGHLGRNRPEPGPEDRIRIRPRTAADSRVKGPGET